MALPLSKLFVRAPVVPVVRLTGIIGADGTPFRPGLSLARVEAPLEAAFSMKKAAAVAVVINSPGGSPVQSRLIHDRIRQLADRHGRKVLVFCEDVAASGGYMIAVAGDEIFVDAASVVGSIGVISQGFGLKGLIDRLGIERRVHTAGTRKAILDPFSPERPEDVAHLEALQAEIHAGFIALVRERRGSRLAEDPDLFSGLFWTGARAISLGLADGIGYPRAVLEERYGKDVVLKPVGPRKRGFLRLGLGARAHDPAELTAGVLSALEARGWWSRHGL
ncbi:S49 family peptidase [Segnochrobactraceae bacterium EtOH-i3]